MSMSRTWAASCLAMPRRVLTSPATAVLSRWRASHRLRMASVGLGWAEKKLVYRVTPRRSASSRQSLLLGAGGSSSCARLAFTDTGMRKAVSEAAAEAREEQPELARLDLARQLRSETLATRAKAARRSVTSCAMLESTYTEVEESASSCPDTATHRHEAGAGGEAGAMTAAQMLRLLRRLQPGPGARQLKWGFW